MKMTVAALGAAILLGGWRADPEVRVDTWSQTRGGSVWTLTAVVTETTGPNQWPGELIRFTVRRDGRFLHSSSSFDGGRLAGMKRCFGGPTQFTVEDLLPEAGPGWILHVAESTGSATSFLACVVTPVDRDAHDAVMIATKDPLKQRVSREGVELWGSYQEWGGGGTSTSVFVPFRLVVRAGHSLRREPLSSDPSECLQVVDGIGFNGIFVAGIRERNPDLMQAALDRMFVTSEVSVAPSMEGGLGLPTRRADLEEVVKDVRILAEARADLRRRVESIAPDDPLGLVPLN